MIEKFLLTSGLMILGILGDTQPAPGPAPNGLCTKSDLQVQVGATFNATTGGKTFVSGHVSNLGPNDYLGGRNLKITATTNGKTETCLEPTKITKLKVHKNGGGFFSKECVAPGGVTQKTVYKAIVSPVAAGCDSNSSNNFATQVGSSEGKP